jgi:hypothetical protein
MHMVDLRQTKQYHLHNLTRQTREKDLHHHHLFPL